MTNEILVIDDNPDIRRLISGILKDKGFVVREAANFDQAMLEINKKLPDVAIIDVKLDKGDNDGIELLVHLKRIDDDVPVIMISGHANVQMAVDSLKLGAFEFIQKPFSSERLVNFANRAAENINLKKEKRVLENKLFNSYEIIGQSQTIEEIRNLIVKLSGTESRVFISGPAGSGKELVARQIHKQSSRSRKPFVVVNGALLAPNKYELELFGSESKNETINYGFFEKAKDGTLLIDEISEIPLETQAKILRVLIDQKFRRVNGSKEINVNVRIISTSSKNIREEVDKGNFREDLYHRLNVVPIFLPPLKDRTEDIPSLLNYFSKKIAELNGISETKLDTNFDLYYKYDWPGNVRELEHVISRAALKAKQQQWQQSIVTIEPEHCDIAKTTVAAPSPVAGNEQKATHLSLKEATDAFSYQLIMQQLELHNLNWAATARSLSVDRANLVRLAKRLGISVKKSV